MAANLDWESLASNIDENGESSLVNKLLSKISTQADELLAQKNQILDAENIIQNLETHMMSKSGGITARTTSEIAQKRRMETEHRDQINALQRQLSNAEKRLRESASQRNQQAVDMEHKAREIKFIEARCSELQQENHRLKTLVEVSVRGPTGSEKTSTQTKVHTQSLRDELKSCKETLRLKLDEMERLRQQVEDAAMKNKILEKALEFRADEIGLTGHADLLAKVAGLRGEVSALKNDLMDKRKRLHDIEEEKQLASEQNLSLQEQIHQIQQRLAQSRSDIHRLEDGEQLLDQLRQTEQERDVLLEFIQEDVQKSASHTAAADNAIREASVTKRALKEAQESAQAHAEAARVQHSLVSELESVVKGLNVELMLVKDSLARDQRDLETCRLKLDKKDTEIQEMNKIHVVMLGELKAKDEHVSTLSSENKLLKINLQESETNLHRSQTDLLSVETQVSKLSAEISALKENAAAHAVGAKQKRDADNHRVELDKLISENQRLDGEVRRLQLIEQQLGDLKKDLVKVPLDMEQEVVSSSVQLDLAHRHVSWTAIPALRLLCPALYSNIRRMFQDLHNKEIECRQLISQLDLYKKDEKNKNEEYTHEMQRLNDFESRFHQQSAEDKSRIDELEREVRVYRSKALILDQIREVIKSLVSEASADRAPSVKTSNESRFNGSFNTSNNYSRGRLHSDDVSESDVGDEILGGYEYDDTIGTINKQHNIRLHSSTSLLEEIASGNMKPQMHSKVNTVEGGINDEGLPSVLSSLLSKHLTAAVRVDDCLQELRTVRFDRDRALEELAHTSAEVVGLRQQISNIQNEFGEKNQRYEDGMMKIQREFSTAVELNEKQNALAITLEAKVEELKRKLSVNSAQLISSQQRDDVFKTQFFNMFFSFVTRVSGVVSFGNQNCFCANNLSVVKTHQMFVCASETLNVVAHKLTGIFEDQNARVDRTEMSYSSDVAADVSQHYRHWQQTPSHNAFYRTASEMTKTNILTTDIPHSHFLNEESISFGLPPQEMSFSMSNRPAADERLLSSRKDDLRRDIGETRSLQSPASSQSEMFDRFRKAKVAFNYLKNDRSSIDN